MKEKKINLVEILKNCPKGTILYSTIHGNVEFEGIDTSDEYTIKVAATCNGNRTPAWFTSDGRYFRYYLEGDCVLFPSKDCRDWSQFERSLHNEPTDVVAAPQRFDPFDKVIVCDGLKDAWCCSLYSHPGKLKNLAGVWKNVHCVINGVYNYCLPYKGNEHLVGQVFKEEHLK